MDGGLLSLRWNDHGQTFFSMLSSIRKKGSYTDVTLACDGRFYPAHRLVLSTCSEYFEQMFERTNSKHVFIVIANINNKDLEALLNYMYLGEITVLQKDLSTLMKAAESLRIKGLAEPTSGSSASGTTKHTDKESKRPHEEEARENKRKRVEESSVRKTAETTERTSKQPDPSSRTHNSTSGGTVGEETWLPAEGGVRLGEISGVSSGESGNKSSQPDDSNISLVDLDVDPPPLPPSPEVKMEEEVSVKDEPTSWYNDNDNADPSTSLDYSGDGVFQTGARGPGAAGSSWGIMQAPIDSHLLHGLPGTSVVPGMPDFISTRRGRRKILLDGYAYIVNKMKDNVTYWRCERIASCGGKLTTVNDNVKGEASYHSHPPDPTRNMALKTVQLIKERAKQTEDSPSTIIQTFTSFFPSELVDALPKKKALEKMVRRYRTLPDADTSNDDLWESITGIHRSAVFGDNFGDSQNTPQ